MGRQEAYIQEEQELKRQQRHRRRRDRRRRALGFGLLFFLLGVLCGRVVFAKEAKEEKLQETEGGWLSERNAGAFDTEAEQKEPVEGDWRLALVNSSHPLEEGYEPVLAEAECNYYLDERIVPALQQMLRDGRNEGLDFWICSAYRTIEKQTELYENKVSRLKAAGRKEKEALREAAAEVAYPGTSEHHLGLAVDIVARDYQLLDEKQARTREAQWLAENCWKYGFILRYPPDKTAETGIIFEPWHYRYVGEEAAREIMERGICLEEYLEEYLEGERL